MQAAVWVLTEAKGLVLSWQKLGPSGRSGDHVVQGEGEGLRVPPKSFFGLPTPRQNRTTSLLSGECPIAEDGQLQ